MSTNPISGLIPSFIGSSTVLNDSRSTNVLTVALTNGNMMQTDNAKKDGTYSAHDNIMITKTLGLAFYFIADGNNEQGKKNIQGDIFELNWALASKANIDGIVPHLFLPGESIDYASLSNKQRTPAGWQITGHTPNINFASLSTLEGWIITPPAEGKMLKPGQSLILVFTNVISDLPDGPSRAYMGYEEKHFIKCGPLQKTPNIVSGEQVGIGLTDPQFPLTISTDVKTKGQNGAIWSLSKFAIKNGEKGENFFGIAAEKMNTPHDLEGYVNYLVPKNHGHVFAAETGEKSTGLMWIRDPGDVTVARDLDVLRNAHIAQDIRVGGATNLMKALTVDGNANLKQDLTIGGAANLKQALTVGGAANLKQALTVGGATNLKQDLTVGGATNLKQGLTVDGASNLTQNLIVGGDTNLKNKLTVGGELSVTGNVDSVIKVFTKNFELGGLNSRADNTISGTDWIKTINFGFYFKEIPQVLASISTFSALVKGSKGGNASIGYAYVHVRNITRTSVDIHAYVSEGNNDWEKDNWLAINVLAIGRI